MTHDDVIITEITIMQNMEGIAIIIKVFEKLESNSEIKTDLLNVLRAIFQLESTFGFPSVDQLLPFNVLFAQFDNLSVHNKNIVLNTLDEILTKEEIQYEEWKSFWGLLIGRKPSTILMVTNHLIRLFSGKSDTNPTIRFMKGLVSVTPEQLRKINIVATLGEYLILPKQLPSYLVLKTDPEELELCFSIVQKSDTSGMFSDTELDISQNTEKGIEIVLYGILRNMMELVTRMVLFSAENQNLFRENNWYKHLYDLLEDEKLRKSALRLIAILAIGDSSIENKIIPDLVSILQRYGGTAALDPKLLSMRKGILYYILFKNRYFGYFVSYILSK